MHRIIYDRDRDAIRVSTHKGEITIQVEESGMRAAVTLTVPEITALVNALADAVGEV